MENPLAFGAFNNGINNLRIPSNNVDSNFDQLRLRSQKLQYPHRLSLYDRPPPVEISIEEFEQFALDRLQGRHFSIGLNSISIFSPESH